jgi:hypothetical protein
MKGSIVCSKHDVEAQMHPVLLFTSNFMYLDKDPIDSGNNILLTIR